MSKLEKRKLDLSLINFEDDLKLLVKDDKKEITKKLTNKITEVKRDRNTNGKNKYDKLIYFKIHEEDSERVKFFKYFINKNKITFGDLYETIYASEEGMEFEQARTTGQNIYRSLMLRHKKVNMDHAEIWAKAMGKNFNISFDDEPIPLPDDYSEYIDSITLTEAEYKNGIFTHEDELEQE